MERRQAHQGQNLRSVGVHRARVVPVGSIVGPKASHREPIPTLVTLIVTTQRQASVQYDRLLARVARPPWLSQRVLLEKVRMRCHASSASGSE
jgi:hypothetical protein